MATARPMIGFDHLCRKFDGHIAIGSFDGDNTASQAEGFKNVGRSLSWLHVEK